MKKIVYLLTLVLISSSGFSQVMDFSGTWKINKEKSELGQEFSMAPNELILEQGENSLLAERHSTFNGEDFTFTEKMTLDGKECENPAWRDSIKKSTAVWSGDNKVLTIKSKIPIQDGEEMTIIQKYKMEGENLSIETSASSSYGDMTEHFIFEKQ